MRAGRWLKRPFEIRIGFVCGWIEDPWKNLLVILDSLKGVSSPTDAERNVIESGAAEAALG